MPKAHPWKMKDTCPKCGSHLILREGQFGDFLACPRFPECKYTQPSKRLEEMYVPPSPYCDECKHTGLVPFKNEAGKVIPHTYLYCKCNQPEEAYFPTKPEDWDFPMSDTFRGFSFEHCGQRDPGRDNIPAPERHEVETTVRHVVVHDFAARRQIAELEQLRQHVIALEKNQHTKGKAKSKYT